MGLSKKRIQLYFIILFIFSFSLIFFIITNDKNERINLIERNQIENLKILYKFIQRDFELTATARYEMILNDEKIMQILEKAKDLPLNKQKKLRDELYDYLEPLFLRLKDVGLTNLHFVFENNKTFLRMHKPEKYGDDLSRYRYTFQYVNEFRTPISGFEQGRTKHGFRFVYPIFNRRGYYLGAVDFTFSSDYLQKVLSNYLNIHSHFIVDKKIFNDKAWRDGGVAYSYVVSKESDKYLNVKRYSYYSQKKEDEHFAIEDKLKKEIEANIKYGKDFALYTIKNSKAVLVTFLAIKNVKDKKIVAYIVTYTDNRTIYDIVNRYKLLVIILFVGVFVVLFVLYKLVIQRKMLKEEVQRQVSKIKKLYESYDENVIASSTDLHGVIEHVSNAFCKISGYTRDELIGKTHRVIKHPSTPKFVFDDLWETITHDKEWKGIIKNKKKDGSFYWVDIVISPIYNDKGKKVGYSAIRHDITDKKELERLNQTLEENIVKEVENLRQKDKQLLQQSRLAQMGEMISMIAHQWRQPLSAISSTSAALNLKAKLNTLDEDTVVEFSEKIASFAQHLSSTIDDFRDFFKPNKKQRTTTFEEMIQSVLQIIGDSIKNRGIELKTDLKCNMKIKTYPNEIKQVILNLIKNAEDALLEKHVKNPYIRLISECRDDTVVLRVEDNAGGIPENIIDKIFDPYFSTKTERDGTGLGLYMSKTIIEEHCDGRLKVYNKGNGAVFEIILPVYSD